MTNQDATATAMHQPPDLLSTLADLPLRFWHWFDSVTGLPHWVLPAYLAAFYAFRLISWVVRKADLGMVPHRETSDPKDASLSGRGVDASDDGPRSDRWWRCRFSCGEGRSFYGTAQQEASEALAHQAVCQQRADAPAVRRCTECAAPIDPVDDLLNGLFEDDEPGPPDWKPGMPPWGTPPLLPLQNHARAELFRQMMSDALRRSKGGPV